MGKPYVVGVTGGSGSGKTTFVRELSARLGESATAFKQDDYYRPQAEQQRDANGIHNFDLPTSIDSATMAEEIRAVLAGRTVEREEYGFETVYRDGSSAANGRRSPRLLRLGPAPVLIVEGLFVLHEPALRELMDLAVFVDATDVAKLTRRIKRDRIERDLPLEDVLYRYEGHVLPAYETFIKPHRREADVIVNNGAEGYGEALEMLVAFLRAKAPAGGSGVGADALRVASGQKQE